MEKPYAEPAMMQEVTLEERLYTRTHLYYRP
jgi:hypothetical protein